MSTQWNVGMGGATGINYTPLVTVMKLIGIKKSARSQAFADLQIMESEALSVIEEMKPPSK
jgi:hypothetical protein